MEGYRCSRAGAKPVFTLIQLQDVYSTDGFPKNNIGYISTRDL